MRHGRFWSLGDRRCLSFFRSSFLRLHGVLLVISHQKIRMGGQDYEFGVFQEFQEVVHGGGMGWVGELDCITGWSGLVFS